MSKLFSSISLGKMTLKNRIAIAPMCQYSAHNGEVSSWHAIHLGHLALSGAGILFVEATTVEPEGRISPDDLGLWSDTTEQALGNVLQSDYGSRTSGKHHLLRPSRYGWFGTRNLVRPALALACGRKIERPD